MAGLGMTVLPSLLESLRLVTNGSSICKSACDDDTKFDPSLRSYYYRFAYL